MVGQRSLFADPPRDIWSSEQMRRMAAEGFYWTPEGPQNGPYVAPPKGTPEDPKSPQRARPHRHSPAKQVLA